MIRTVKLGQRCQFRMPFLAALLPSLLVADETHHGNFQLLLKFRLPLTSNNSRIRKRRARLTDAAIGGEIVAGRGEFLVGKRPETRQALKIQLLRGGRQGLRIGGRNFVKVAGSFGAMATTDYGKRSAIV